MGHAFLAAASPLDHVYQWTYQKIAVGAQDSVFTPDGQITLVSNHVIMQIIAMLLLVLLIPRFVRMGDTGDTVEDLTPGGFGNFIESICAYFRETVARPVLHEHTDRFIAYIWTGGTTLRTIFRIIVSTAMKAVVWLSIWTTWGNRTISIPTLPDLLTMFTA